MGEQTAISWTDATWNPVRGCVKVSPGCAHCYAETFAERFRGVKGHPYEQGFDLRLVPEKLDAPLHWKKPRRVFVNSMSDLFQDGVPDEYIDRVFAVMALCPQHTFQVLTKRAERMCDYCGDDATTGRLVRTIGEWTDGIGGVQAHFSHRCDGLRGVSLPNVWLGVSVENQHFADERIPLLMQTPASVRFVSAEPLLGPLDLTGPLNGYPEQTSQREYVTRDMAIDAGDASMEGSLYSDEQWQQTSPALDWVIAGGESGAKCRPSDPDWFRSLRDQCVAAGVPFHFKQHGGRTPKANGRELDGREWLEFPAERYEVIPMRRNQA